MKSIEKIPSPEKDEELEKFRQEIGALKAEDVANRARGETHISTHFEDLEPEELTESDMVIWQWFKEGTLTANELKEYGAGVFKTESKSRMAFYGYVANKLNARQMKEELAAWKAAKEKGEQKN